MAGAVVTTQQGPVIVILRQYAYTGQGKMIHLSAQLEWFANNVNDKSVKVSGGLQHIVTNDGYLIPISMKDGLPSINLCPYTDSEWDNLPHMILTGDADWDPGILDCDYEDSDTWHDALSKPTLALPDPCFDEFGDYCKCILVQEHYHDAKDWACTTTAANKCAWFHTCLTPDMSLVDPCQPMAYDLDGTPTQIVCCDSSHEGITAHAHQVTKKLPDYIALHPMFRWLPEDIIKGTFEVTTQYAHLPMSTLLKKQYKSPFPVLNVHRRDNNHCHRHHLLGYSHY